jgi:hypothetical protein
MVNRFADTPHSQARARGHIPNGVRVGALVGHQSLPVVMENAGLSPASARKAWSAATTCAPSLVRKLRTAPVEGVVPAAAPSAIASRYVPRLPRDAQRARATVCLRDIDLPHW